MVWNFATSQRVLQCPDSVSEHCFGIQVQNLTCWGYSPSRSINTACGPLIGTKEKISRLPIQ